MRLDLSEDEMIVIREAVRKLPTDTEFSTLYDREIANIDRKMTDALAACFDARMSGRRSI